MEQLHLPQVLCPFPASISRFVDEVNAHNMYWVQKFGLTSSPQVFEAYRKARFPWFASRIYHAAGYADLCLICDFCTWLFIMDDLLEKIAGNRKEHARIMKCMTCVLDNNEAPAAGNYVKLAASLKDIWERLQAITPASWQHRFSDNMKDLFDAAEWEASNRASAYRLGIAEYIKMRPYTSAMLPCIDLIEVIGQSWLPEDLRRQELLQKLVFTCIEAVCWVNDLVSFNKEQCINEPHNLVLLLQVEQGFSPYDAIREVTEVCNETIRHFIFLERKLLTSVNGWDEHLLHFTDGLRSWIRGNLDWCLFDTERYGLQLAKNEEGSLLFSKIFLDE
ncbi:MAG TPA: hypothetical protein VGD35_02135 [Chitinophaga sp.]